MASQIPPGDGEYGLYTPLTRWIALFAVMLGTVLEVLDVSVVNVAIPEMMGNLGATLDQIGWVSTGYIIANVIILPLTGWLSAVFGRRRYLAGSMVLFTVASVFCGTSRSLNELVFFRVMQGVGGAALLSTAQATLLEIFPPRQVGMVQGIFSLGVVVAPTVGPTLGGWITDHYSWPWVFFINLPIGIVATVLTLLFIKDSKYKHKANGGVDFLGIGFLAIGLGCLQTVLERGNREGWLESSMISWLSVLSAVSMIAFVAWELHTPNPAVNLRLFRYRTFVAGCAIGLILGFGLYGGIFILPIFLQNLRHFNAEQTGLLLFPGGIASGITALIVGRFVSKTDPRALLLFGSVCIIVSMLMLHTITSDTGASNLYWPLVVRGVGLGLIFVPLTFVTLTGLKGRDVSYGTGLFNLMRQLGGSVGIAYLSTVVDQRTAQHRAALVEHISVFSPATTLRIEQLQHMFVAKGMSAGVAHQQAMKMIDNTVQVQAAVMAFEDAFLAIAIAFAVVLPLVFLFKKSTRPAGHALPD
ncbi:MAG: DHA2 family efflux MFS transporter permease subunit [Armatimonadota bacterium]